MSPRRRPIAGLCLLAVVSLAATRGPAAAGPADPAARAAAAEIDRVVLARLGRLGIAPAPVCSDEVFLRRAHLDVMGTLPTADEARAFLADPSPDRRAALVERLLARDEFADYGAMRWSGLLRVKSEFPINLWPNAVQAYHRWIRDAIARNVPYDRFARDLLTSSGSNFRVPPVNFYRAVPSREPATLARAAALTFLGCRAEAWPKERLDGMAGFFARVGYKTTEEWKEEIVFDDAARAGAPTSATFPDGTRAALAPDRDPREAFADWLLSPGNPWFARAIANRAWSWLLGTGVVEEPDDLRPDNPPSNPELLAVLEREVVAGGYDLKHLYRAILGSQTWQRASAPASPDPRAEAEFAVYRVRRLEAEVLIDAIDQVTGTTETYTSKIPEPYTVMPAAQRAIALPDSSVTSPFLDLFGRSPRDTGLESEQRASLPTAAQALHLANSSHVRKKIEEGPGLRDLSSWGLGTLPTIDALYLTILSRRPTPEERREVAVAAATAGSPAARRRVALDVAWALINSTEFQYRH